MAFPSAFTHEKTLQTICTCFFYSFSLEFVVSQHSNKQMTRHSTMVSPPSLRRKQCRFAVWSHWASQPAEAFWLCIEHRICMNKKNIYTSRHLLKKHHKKECKPPAHCERGPAGHWPFAHANIPVFQHHQDKHIVHQETMNGAAVIWKNDPWLPTMAEMKSQAQHDDCVHVLHLREEQTAMSTSIDYDSGSTYSNIDQKAWSSKHQAGPSCKPLQRKLDVVFLKMKVNHELKCITGHGTAVTLLFTFTGHITVVVLTIKVIPHDWIARCKFLAQCAGLLQLAIWWSIQGWPHACFPNAKKTIWM